MNDKTYPKPTYVLVGHRADPFSMVNEICSTLERSGIPDAIVSRFLARTLEEVRVTDARMGCMQTLRRVAEEYVVFGEEGEPATPS